VRQQPDLIFRKNDDRTDLDGISCRKRMGAKDATAVDVTRRKIKTGGIL